MASKRTMERVQEFEDKYYWRMGIMKKALYSYEQYDTNIYYLPVHMQKSAYRIRCTVIRIITQLNLRDRVQGIVLGIMFPGIGAAPFNRLRIKKARHKDARDLRRLRREKKEAEDFGAVLSPLATLRGIKYLYECARSISKHDDVTNAACPVA